MDSRDSGKMSSLRKKAASFAVRENIEMKRFSSEETLEVAAVSERLEEHGCCKGHPLAPDSWEDSEAGRRSGVQEAAQRCSLSATAAESVEIEMKILSPVEIQSDDLVEIKSSDSSVLSLPSPNKRNRMKWTPLVPAAPRLVVKDVLCLPRGQDLSALERPVGPLGVGEPPAAVIGLSARITLDSSWSSSQTCVRLRTLFQDRFRKPEGQTFSFSYLQCVQGTRVLFVPNTPADGWTGEQVLRVCGHGVLYILSHHDYLQDTGKQPPP